MVSEIMNSMTDKFNFILGYKCINKFENIIKVQNDKTEFMSNNNVL